MLGCALGATTLACGDEAEPRAQVLVVLETNAPLVSQLAGRPELSPDSVVDTLLVEVIGTDQALEVLVGDALDWPVSFGVTSRESPPGSTVRIRARLFRTLLARPPGAPEPHWSTSIDRIIDVSLPERGVREHPVLLDMDCLGVRPSFAQPATTCIDAGDRHGSPAEQRAPGSPAAEPGSWQPALERPCTGTAFAERVCIAGGFSALGEADLVGFVDGQNIDVDPAPVRPVLLSPFRLDRTEYTVGRLRALLEQDPNAVTELPALHDAADPDRALCTWRGVSDAGSDAMPLNCVTRATARDLCALAGGALPSEAEWEHAARGRGQRREFPWGEGYPECCMLSAGRDPADGECAGAGPESVGSHPPSAACGGLGDETRDGVLDMAGSLREMTDDSVAAYDDLADCWQPDGILVEPRCSKPEEHTFIARGVHWSTNPTYLPMAMRFNFLEEGISSEVGFRCAYPEP
jgi:formylglycine-generating enzyme required for sulfatase activity